MGTAIDGKFGSIFDAIFTKEDYEVFKGIKGNKLREVEIKLYDYLGSHSSDTDIENFIQWINMRKTRSGRLEHKRLLIETVKDEVLRLFDIKQNIHTSFASLPLPEITVTVTILGQPIEFTLKDVGFLKASVNIEIPVIGWQFGFASPQQIMINWEAEVEAMILVKQSYLHSILEQPLLEF